MNRTFKLVSALLAAVLGLMALSGCAAPTPAAAANGDSQTPHTITVTGNGTAYGTPDMAVGQIGVQTRNPDPNQAVSENTAKMNALIAALRELGIEEKDIQTTNFSVYAQTDYDPQTGQPRGTITYVVENIVTITIRDLSQVGTALGNAVNAGANNIYGVSFSVSDAANLEAEARGKAMADARARAEQLAQAAGVTLDVPMSISEYTGGPVPFAMDRMAVESAQVGGGPVPVSSGQIQVNMQVSVTYIIK